MHSFLIVLNQEHWYIKGYNDGKQKRSGAGTLENRLKYLRKCDVDTEDIPHVLDKPPIRKRSAVTHPELSDEADEGAPEEEDCLPSGMTVLSTQGN